MEGENCNENPIWHKIGDGYIDIALLPNNVFEVNNYFIFEAKYISRKNDSAKARNDKRAEAMEQIKRYAGSEELCFILSTAKIQVS